MKCQNTSFMTVCVGGTSSGAIKNKTKNVSVFKIGKVRGFLANHGLVPPSKDSATYAVV